MNFVNRFYLFYLTYTFVKFIRILTFLFIILFALLLSGCNKIDPISDISISKEFITEKLWILDYSISVGGIKNYTGQSTYEVVFFKNDSTKDSDGLMGTYVIQKNNSNLQLVVKAVTPQRNMVNYLYNIVSIGEKKLVLSYDTSGKLIKHYYSSK